MVDDIVLRKYKSRLFFDATRRRVLTLPEIAVLVKAGANLSALDAAGRDIAGEVLGQIVRREEAEGQDGPLSPNAMRNIIRLSQSDLKSLLPLQSEHLASMLETLPAQMGAPLRAPKERWSADTTCDDEIAAQVERAYAKRLLSRA